MVGGVISGYWATGRPKYEMPPTSVMRMATTAAKIGRSTKKCVKRMASCPLAADALALRRQYRDLRVDLHARPHAHDAVDHNGVVARQALADDAVAVDARPRLDRPRRHFVVGPDHVDDATVLIGGERLV